ncbi:MAG TPA: hypothetical protein VFS00_03185 [Polyangiaceae bacterium]|nr:hypothetical protein [Polyangiaceae bacterium]
MDTRRTLATAGGIWVAATVAGCASAPAGPAPATSAAERRSPPSTSASAPAAAPVAAPAPSPVVPDGALDLTTPGEPPPAVPAAPYARLFASEQAWQVAGTNKKSYFDGAPRRSSSAIRGTCRVTEVTSFGWGLRGKIACEGLSGGVADPFTGTWFATREGLYRGPLDHAGGSVLRSELRFVIAAAPAPAKKKEALADEPDQGLLREVRRKGNGWCVDETSWGADEGWEGVCFEPSVGFTAGTWGWAGGSTDDSKVTVTPAK